MDRLSANLGKVGGHSYGLSVHGLSQRSVRRLERRRVASVALQSGGRMKHLPVIIMPLVYAFIFGAFVTQGMFYLYEREATGLLYVLSVAIFAAIGYICAFIFLTIRSIDEREEILRYRIEMLEEKVEELEREQLIAKYPELVD